MYFVCEITRLGVSRTACGLSGRMAWERVKTGLFAGRNVWMEFEVIS